MRYLVTLTPLEPFLFGGDNTYGKLQTDEMKKNEGELGTYLVHSRQFPQQSAILGMLKKEIMTQDGVLTRKVRGEWVDEYSKTKANNLVGTEKFDITKTTVQNFEVIKSLEPVFLMKNDKKYIKKVAIDTLKYSDSLLDGYDPKKDIYDNFILINGNEYISSEKIFEAIEQIGNKKGGKENSLFKKTSYKLKPDFKFAFYLECEYSLKNSIITLGADRSSFKMELIEDNSRLDYYDENGYLTLLSDAYITIPLKENCDFAVTSEISYQHLIGQKSSMTKNVESKKNKQNNPFQKSNKVYLYEKGSVIINPSSALLDNLNNKNLQQIGYNKYTQKGQN